MERNTFYQKLILLYYDNLFVNYFSKNRMLYLIKRYYHYFDLRKEFDKYVDR